MNKWALGYRTPPPTLEVSYQGQPVAELKKEKGKFFFRYLESFSLRSLAPLPGLPHNASGFVSFNELPAFFRERLPDTRRPEIRQYILANKLDEDDELMMLACLSKHSITDSFELSLRSAA